VKDFRHSLQGFRKGYFSKEVEHTKKRGKWISDFAAYCRFLSSSTPTMAIATIIATVAATM